MEAVLSDGIDSDESEIGPLPEVIDLLSDSDIDVGADVAVPVVENNDDEALHFEELFGGKFFERFFGFIS